MRIRIQRWAVIAAVGALTATGLHAQVKLERPSALRPPTPLAPTVAVPPASVTVTGTPGQAHVMWGSVDASSYTVQRWKQTDPNCCRASSPALAATATTWDDPVQWSGTYVYRVSAIYPGGGEAFVDVNYTRPEPTNPATLNAHLLWSGFKKVTQGPGLFYWSARVGVEWDSVPGAAYYVVWGPEWANSGITVEASAPRVLEKTFYYHGGVKNYVVGAFFLPGPVSTPAADFTKGSVTLPE